MFSAYVIPTIAAAIVARNEGERVRGREGGRCILVTKSDDLTTPSK